MGEVQGMANWWKYWKWNGFYNPRGGSFSYVLNKIILSENPTMFAFTINQGSTWALSHISRSTWFMFDMADVVVSNFMAYWPYVTWFDDLIRLPPVIDYPRVQTVTTTKVRKAPFIPGMPRRKTPIKETITSKIYPYNWFSTPERETRTKMAPWIPGLPKSTKVVTNYRSVPTSTSSSSSNSSRSSTTSYSEYVLNFPELLSINWGLSRSTLVHSGFDTITMSFTHKVRTEPPSPTLPPLYPLGASSSVPPRLRRRDDPPDEKEREAPLPMIGVRWEVLEGSQADFNLDHRNLGLDFKSFDEATNLTTFAWGGNSKGEFKCTGFQDIKPTDNPDDYDMADEAFFNMFSLIGVNYVNGTCEGTAPKGKKKFRAAWSTGLRKELRGKFDMAVADARDMVWNGREDEFNRQVQQLDRYLSSTSPNPFGDLAWAATGGAGWATIG